MNTTTEAVKVTCKSCGAEAVKSECLEVALFGDSANHYYCEDCTFYCEDCGERGITDDSVEVADDRRVCEGCYSDYRRCENCGGDFHVDSSDWSQGQNDMCLSCSESVEESWTQRPWKPDERVINGAHGEIMQTTRLFGLECEVGYPDNEAVDNTRVHINKCIGLYPDSGVEFQTPPASGDKAENMIRNMSAQFIKNKLTVRDGQGLHVHIDAHELVGMSEADRFNRMQGLWLFYIVFDKVIRSFTNKYRQRSARSGGMFGVNIYDYEEIASATSQQELERIWYRESDQSRIDSRKGYQKDGTRYKGFNFHALLNAYHLEIRYHESVLEANKMLEWANLHALIMDKAIAGIDRSWLERMNERIVKRKAMFDYISLSENSRKYFNAKAKNLCAE